MLYLIGSIIFTSWLTLSFKVIEKFGINNLQAIVFNYFTCVVTGSVINGSFPVQKSTLTEPWFPWTLVMGIMFVLLFNLVALTTQRLGVAISSVAYKLSLIIPYLFSIYLYNEKSTLLKTAGIGLALAAVFLTCYRTSKKKVQDPSGFLIWFLPVVLFFGSGFLDTMIKYVEQSFMSGSNNNYYLITAFLVAALAGTVLLGVQLLQKKQRLSGKAALAGLAIGVPNYFSIWCLVKVLKEYGENSSAIIPINNMGIVLFSSVIAFLFLRERLSVLNWMGIALSLGAIALIAYG
ncbi:MAG: EamA/RhaT family transporter [Chitinophagaceae bacterium]|nr:EamA/RhaT family transporter [Chitinophagaceae bacterium]